MAQKYFYDDGEEKLGPVHGGDLLQLLSEGKITRDTWVRRAESSTWRRLADTDLKKAEESEKRKSFWRLLWRQMTPATIFGIIALILFIVGLLFAGIMLLKVLGPFILVLLFAWMVMRVFK